MWREFQLRVIRGVRRLISSKSSHLTSSHRVASHRIASPFFSSASSHLIPSYRTSSHLISSHRIASHRISFLLLSSVISFHLISSHPISSHLVLSDHCADDVPRSDEFWRSQKRSCKSRIQKCELCTTTNTASIGTQGRSNGAHMAQEFTINANRSNVRATIRNRLFTGMKEQVQMASNKLSRCCSS